MRIPRSPRPKARRPAHALTGRIGRSECRLLGSLPVARCLGRRYPKTHPPEEASICPDPSGKKTMLFHIAAPPGSDDRDNPCPYPNSLPPARSRGFGGENLARRCRLHGPAGISPGRIRAAMNPRSSPIESIGTFERRLVQEQTASQRNLPASPPKATAKKRTPPERGPTLRG